MTDTVSMLFGAALFSSGVLASALADRIRGLRSAVPAPARESRRPVQTHDVVDPSVSSERAEPQPRQKPRASGTPLHGVAKVDDAPDAESIIEVVHKSGFKKAIAVKVVNACTPQERATPELWIAAALRRCAMGGAS